MNVLIVSLINSVESITVGFGVLGNVLQSRILYSYKSGYYAHLISRLKKLTPDVEEIDSVKSKPLLRPEAGVKELTLARTLEVDG